MAYGVNAPFGLQPRRLMSGALWNGAANEYQIKNTSGTGYATSLFTGDPVTLLSDGTLGIGVAGSAIIGVFQGCKYTTPAGTDVTAPYWPASTAVLSGSTITAYVVDDPMMIFDAQVDTTGLVLTNMNQNANFVAGTGSTVSGQSTYAIDYSSLNTTATLNLKLLRLTPQVNNAFGVNYNNAEVLINNHIYKGGTGTAGV